MPRIPKKKLHDYQTAAVNKVLKELPSKRAGILALPTGSGKTFTATAIMKRWQAEYEGPIVWVCMNVELLRQALATHAHELKCWHFKYKKCGGIELQTLAKDENPDGDAVIYVMLQGNTANGGLDDALDNWQPSLLIWDEAHYGGLSQTGLRLKEACSRHKIPWLGLTATPRLNDKTPILFHKTFAELVEKGYLAKPILRPISIATKWAPRVEVTGDFAGSSLKELAADRARTKRIIEEIDRRRYQHAIVFACSVPHAIEIAERLYDEHGISAEAVYSERPQAEIDLAYERFHNGECNVLVSMMLLVFGFDAPAVDAVILARPTRSEALLMQMIGRGARRDPKTNKTKFDIVQVVDAISNDVPAVLVKDFPEFAQASRPARVTRSRPTRRHEYDPAGKLDWFTLDVCTTPFRLCAIRGQTFGVEFELAPQKGRIPAKDSAAWIRVAEGLVNQLVQQGLDVALREPKEEAEPGQWKITHDGSCGWEVVSPVLMDQAGYEEIISVCDALTDAAESFDLVTNHKTGMHIHLGWHKTWRQHQAKFENLVKLTKQFEPTVATVVAPSRIWMFDGKKYDSTQPNQYCRPISSVFPERRAFAKSVEAIVADEKEDARYVSLNMKPLLDGVQPTVEVRLHNGTTEAPKVLMWLSLWQQILFHADRDSPTGTMPDDTEVIEPKQSFASQRNPYRNLITNKNENGRLFLEQLQRRAAELAPYWKDARKLLK